MKPHNENRVFQHFLLTPFNALPAWVSPWPDEAWHKHRFKLFDQFCYPSVFGQSNQNFKWIVVFSIKTQQGFKQKINQYSEYENFIPVYIPEDKHPDEVPHEIIPQYLADKTKYLITTRVETDDAICKDYVQMIHDCFDKQKFQFINFLNGYVWNTNTYEIYSDKQTSNPFISLIEKIDNKKDIYRIPRIRHDKYPSIINRRFVTVWNGISHPDFIKIAPYRDVQTKPAWMQGVHGRNQCNVARGELQPPRILKQLDRDFEFIHSVINSCV